MNNTTTYELEESFDENSVQVPKAGCIVRKALRLQAIILFLIFHPTSPDRFANIISPTSQKNSGM